MGDTIVSTDAACDMPRSMIDQLELSVVPFRIRAGDTFVEDRRDEVALPLYRKHLVADEPDRGAERGGQCVLRRRSVRFACAGVIRARAFFLEHSCRFVPRPQTAS